MDIRLNPEDRIGGGAKKRGPKSRGRKPASGKAASAKGRKPAARKGTGRKRTPAKKPGFFARLFGGGNSQKPRANKRKNAKKNP